METFFALLALCAGNSPVTDEFPAHKGQWRGALMFSLNCAWINGWVNNREAGDLRRHRAHYNVTVMTRSVPRLPMPWLIASSGHITMTSKWVGWRLKSPASRLFTQPFIRAQIKENVKVPRHWPLCKEFTGQMGIDAKTFSIWWRHHVSSLGIDYARRVDLYIPRGTILFFHAASEERHVTKCKYIWYASLTKFSTLGVNQPRSILHCYIDAFPGLRDFTEIRMAIIDLQYGLTERPPWHIAIILGFQVCIHVYYHSV